MTKTVVHLLRHGEVHNPEKLLYGRLPGYFLSELGVQMADRAAAHFAERDITYVVASPLERAQQTARPTAERFGLAIAVDDRLIEADNVFEGKRVAVGDGALREPWAWKYLWNPWRPSWGEPYQQLAARMGGAIESARQAAYGHEAVCVSHQLPIWIARLAAERKPFIHWPTHRQCSLASVTSLVFEEDRLAAIEYAEPCADLVARSNKATGA